MNCQSPLWIRPLSLFVRHNIAYCVRHIKMKANNRQSWNRKDNEERHKGSINIDLIKASEEYARRIDQGDKVPKRKYALCFGYLGTAYQGLQINPDAVTIEAELERALFLCGGIQECNFGFMQKTNWTRCARTDRGVHAATQCCSMKLSLPLANRELFVQQLNSFLPSDIRAHALTKTSKGFNAKSHCTGRIYNYLLPTYMLQSAQTVNKWMDEKFAEQGEVANAGYEGGYVERDSSRSLSEASLRSTRDALVAYRAPPETIELLRAALKQYEGTNLFHNFTTGKTAADKNAQRYILKFSCSDPIVPLNEKGEPCGVEYVLLSVHGQSFLLNQIRKMVGLACDVARGADHCDLSTIKKALSHCKMDVPMAPGLGLYLAQLFFDSYNSKQRYEAQNAARIAANKKAAAAEAEAEAATTTTSTSTDCAATVTAEVVTTAAAVGDNVTAVVAEGTASTVTAATAAVVDDQSAQATKRQKTDDGTAVSTNSAAAAASVVVQEAGEGGEEGSEESELATHEEILWSSDPAISAKIVDYYSNVIHPHIVEEESAKLHFLYYLDFVRSYPHTYQPKAVPIAAPGDGGNKGKGGGYKKGAAASGGDSLEDLEE